MQPELVKSFGYPIEEHQVTTEDGYILALHRIHVKQAWCNKTCFFLPLYQTISQIVSLFLLSRQLYCQCFGIIIYLRFFLFCAGVLLPQYYPIYQGISILFLIFSSELDFINNSGLYAQNSILDLVIYSETIKANELGNFYQERTNSLHKFYLIFRL